ncbi:Fe-S cluster assembly protein SufB [Candidatus Woesearchaeota archaeon]|nr:Fe-S cluster assembly protein SufB [Candidatus Woesearchaeota archaeon]
MAELDLLNLDYEDKYGFRDPEVYVKKLQKGLSAEVVREISETKGEPEWMLKFRLKALDIFYRKKMPQWGADLSAINFDDIIYYIKPSERKATNWEDVPEKIKQTFEKLGIPEAERKFLGGSGAQYESEVVYHKLREDLEKKGVVFLDTDTGLKEYESLFKQHFGTVVPPHDNKFAALNSAAWSGGSFIYVPKNVKVDMPLQAYFRINAQSMGQFERTLIMADEGASVTYVEACTAPMYSTNSLHAAVVELIAMKNSKIRYTTIQNWSSNVYNLVTKRAFAYEHAFVEWIDGNLGCLSGDAQVFLNSNLKPISEVQAGDSIFAMDGYFNLEKRKVASKKFSGKQKIFKLKTLNHREIKATASHPFLIFRKLGKFSFAEWTPLDKIKIGDLIAISGHIPDSGEPLKITFSKKGIKELKIPDETNDDLLWLMGVYIGDGYCDKNRVYFAVPETDKACPKLVRLLKEIFGVAGERKGVVLRIASVDLVRFIKQTLGFYGTAQTKRIPGWIFTIPKSQRLALLDGYIAADGYIRENHTNISITSSNRQLLSEVKMLAITCGLNPMKISTWTRRELKPLGKEIKEYTHHFLYFGEGKFEKDVVFCPVSDITFCGEEDTWDIEVEDSHNFVANGFIVHNSNITMKYPSVYLLGRNAKADILSVAFAGKGQHQDAGGKALHFAPDTTSTIISKSISKGGGRTSYRGLLHVEKGATGVKSNVRCDALILDEASRSDTYPYMKIEEQDTTITHEATVGKIGEDKIFYLMSRGLTEQQAIAMIVLGFVEQFTKELPMEYAVELNRLIRLEMAGSVG